jgi:hypothetical protein
MNSVMTEQHSITPPTDLVRKWATWRNAVDQESFFKRFAQEAAQWGADAELESCCVELDRNVLNGAFYVGGESCPSWHNFARKAISKLRAARRPKPPSLKEQALEALGPEPLPETGPTGDTILNKGSIERHRRIRRALEALPND